MGGDSNDNLFVGDDLPGEVHIVTDLEDLVTTPTVLLI